MATKRKRSNDILVPAKDALKFDNNTIRILVGVPSSPKEYFAYAFQLVDRSRFFRNALSHDWKEATEKIIKLPHDSSEVFGGYLSMVLTGNIAIGEELDREVEHPRDRVLEVVNERYRTLVELFVLRDKLQDVQGMNNVIDAAVEQDRIEYPYSDHSSDRQYGNANSTDEGIAPSEIRSNNALTGSMRHHILPNGYLIEYLYLNTVRPSNLRRLVVDIWTKYPRFLGKNLYKMEFHHEFVLAIAKRLVQLVPTVPTTSHANIDNLRPENYYQEDEINENKEEVPATKQAKTA
ncbi:hypothetical protein FB567DRAFT_601146 [Paraphoma chrysanthemicola]|uniref:BTB domain-containing protein n=1 Tax=Paraphoma chrysanthemicola TaxID=798071 RepID=A0A8K0W4W1_9PLEO|nr:hypothetical protein FB567DRAFT_601146 [Paraphoma chrysanthemicola]